MPCYAGPTKFLFHTTPTQRQREEFVRSADREAWAFFCEQATGKSKLYLDTAAYLYEQERISAAILITENLLHEDLALLEVPKHWPPRIPVTLYIWHSGKAKGKAHRAQQNNLLSVPGMVLLFINIEAIATKDGNAFLQALMTARPTLLVLDESSSIGNPSTAQTKAALALRRSAVARRIGNGTPAAEGPLKVWSQGKFLSPGFLDGTYTSHKHRYALWRPLEIPGRQRAVMVQATDHQGRKMYQNLERLHAELIQFASFITKAESFDLPPKQYQRVPFVLDPRQLAASDNIRNDLVHQFDSGQQVTARAQMTARIRLQQIASGYVPCDLDMVDPFLAATAREPELYIFPVNPRLIALDMLLDRIPAQQQTLIWVKFQQDGRAIMDLFRRRGERASLFDGTVTSAERLAGKAAFLSGEIPRLVASPQAAARGYNLQVAHWVIYYSHHESYELRIQSEDRTHRHGMPESGCVYIDLVGQHSLDEDIMRAHASKSDVMTAIHTGRLAPWLRPR